MQTLADLHAHTPTLNTVTNQFVGVSKVETVTTPENTTPENDSENEKKDPKYVAVSMFPALLEALRENAKDKPLGTYAQQLIADALGVTIPSSLRTRTKYATEEERENAKVKAQKSRAATVKYLMAEHRVRTAYAENTEPAKKDIDTINQGRADGMMAGFELKPEHKA